MSDEFAAVVMIVSALNPAAAALIAGAPLGPRVAVLGTAAGLCLLVALALASEPILDALAVSPESFRVAAGIVMAAVGARWILPGWARSGDESRTRYDAWYPVALPAVAGPAAITATMSAAANDGIGWALAGAVVATVLGGGAMLLRARLTLATAARFIAVLLIVLGVEEIVDGVKAV